MGSIATEISNLYAAKQLNTLIEWGLDERVVFNFFYGRKNDDTNDKKMVCGQIAKVKGLRLFDSSSCA